MNDLGLTLAWLAVQVAILLAPALVLHGLASRRGPAPGAWVAVAEPRAGRGLERRGVRAPDRVESEQERGRGRTAGMVAATSPHRDDLDRARSVVATARHAPAADGGGTLAWLRLAWDRLERGAAEPAARFRPWGSTSGGRRDGRDGPSACLRLIARALGGRALPPARSAGRRPGR